MTKASLRTIIIFLLILLPFGLSAENRTAADNVFIAAHRAFLAKNLPRLVEAAEKTRGHILDVYVRFWILSLRLNDADPNEIKDFLKKNADTPLAGELHRKWVHLLGENSEWETFRVEFPLLSKVDSELRCYDIHDRMERLGLESVASEIKPIWLTPRPIPSGCIPVVDAMAASGLLTSSDIRDRLQALMTEGLLTEARRTAGRYAAEGVPPAGEIEKVWRDPSRFLQQKDRILKTAAGRQLCYFAVVSLARRDLLNAADVLQYRLQEVLPLSDQRRLWTYLAIQGARRHLPEALEWFIKGEKEEIYTDQLAWRVRIALRLQNWTEVKNAIEAMKASERDESAWTYWLGRSLLAAGDKYEADKLFAKISGRHDFYGILAAEELGNPLRLPPNASPPTEEELLQVSELPGIRRAMALYRLHFPTEGAKEWLWCVRSMNDRQLLAASELARANRLWDWSIRTAEMTIAEHNFSLRYQAPYKDLFLKHARVRDLDEAMVLGMVRQESMFNAAARSSAGATGLMQLLPATARMTARKIGMSRFHRSLLTKPEINARLGTSYLRDLLDRFSSNYTLAAAAYNAGPHHAERWKTTTPLEGAIYIESIPFTETRRYVKKVMANAVHYAAVFSRETVSLKRILDKVEGNGSGKGD